MCAADHGHPALVIENRDGPFASLIRRVKVGVVCVRGVSMAHLQADVRVPGLALGEMMVDDRPDGRKQQD